jgi:hypothetical protein
MVMLRMIQKLIDGMNNFDFDPADLMLGVLGITVLVLWMKALQALWKSSLMSMIP